MLTVTNVKGIYFVPYVIFTLCSTNDGEEMGSTANIPEYPPTSGSDKVNI